MIDVGVTITNVKGRAMGSNGQNWRKRLWRGKFLGGLNVYMCIERYAPVHKSGRCAWKFHLRGIETPGRVTPAGLQ